MEGECGCLSKIRALSCSILASESFPEPLGNDRSSRSTAGPSPPGNTPPKECNLSRLSIPLEMGQFRWEQSVPRFRCHSSLWNVPRNGLHPALISPGVFPRSCTPLDVLSWSTLSLPTRTLSRSRRHRVPQIILFGSES